MPEERLTVPAELDGQRLDVALAALLGESRSRAARRIDDGAVTLAGDAVARSTTVRPGQDVVVVSTTPSPTPPPPLPPVRWEDEHLLVLDKPAGIVVHPGIARPDGTLVDALRHAGVPLATGGGPHRPGIVHRLDLGTTGLMVVAKTDVAHHGLVEALRTHDVDRRYVAIAGGRLPAASGRIEVPLGRDQHVHTRFVGDPQGRRAVTHWSVHDEVEVEQAHVSLVGLRLETGRTHQIRAHLRHVGAPVVGDSLYDGRASLAGRDVDRPLLHAHRLRFDHPVDGHVVDVTAALPDDLVAVAVLVGLDPATATG